MVFMVFAPFVLRPDANVTLAASPDGRFVARCGSNEIGEYDRVVIWPTFVSLRYLLDYPYTLIAQSSGVISGISWMNDSTLVIHASKDDLSRAKTAWHDVQVVYNGAPL